MNIEEFQKVELRVAEVREAYRVEGSDKLIRLVLGLGEAGERQVVAGIGKAYAPEHLVGMEIVIVANLEPRQLMGLQSPGMRFAAEGKDGQPVILTVAETVPPGTPIK